MCVSPVLRIHMQEKEMKHSYILVADKCRLPINSATSASWVELRDYRVLITWPFWPIDQANYRFRGC